MSTDTLNPPKPAFVPFGDPAALGLTGFAMTTFFLSAVNAGWFPAGVEGGVFGLAIFYGGIAQVIAGVWEFANRNTFGAVAFTSYGAFWLAFYFLASNAGSLGDSAGSAVSLFLLCWTIFTAYMTIAAWKTSWVTFLIFLALTLTFLFLTLGAFTAMSGLSMVGGYLGLITALLAWYGSFASVTNFTFKRTVIPTGPRS